MTMAIENQQRFGASLSFDVPYTNGSQFTNPWGSNTSPSPHCLYPPTHNNILPNLSLGVKPHQPRKLNSNLPIGSFINVPVSTTSTGNSLDNFNSHHLLNTSQGLLNNNRPVSSGYEQAYSTAPSPGQHPFSPSQAHYEAIGYAPAPIRPNYAIQRADNTRRLSQTLPNESRNFGENIDSNRGLVALSQSSNQQNSYGNSARLRAPGEPYVFPAAMSHTSSSSISSSNSYTPFFGGSVESSISDLTNTVLPSNNSEIDAVTCRIRPRPSNNLGSCVPPAPQSMMGQFSSKASSSTQKKHKCKVCDKRFTRPSSLQTHMYSHTGEKPFFCLVPGCGRHFSVVSNLRRHRKVHKCDARSEGGSEEHQSDE